MDLKIQKYQCNPDVTLREEDEEGGLLFNPDTNQVRIVNATGLFIWKQFSTPTCQENVETAVLNQFEEVTPDIVRTDLEEFLAEMVQTGFIGEVL